MYYILIFYRIFTDPHCTETTLISLTGDILLTLYHNNNI